MGKVIGMMEATELQAKSVRREIELAFQRQCKLELGSGVYALFKGNKAVYVGKATCLAKRIAQHIGNKDFDSYGVIHCHIDHLGRTEDLAISILDPPLNRCGGERMNGRLVRLKPARLKRQFSTRS